MEEHFEWTGERLTTSKTNEIAIHHLHRYAIAIDLAKGKDVLDIASGEGYGSNLLAKTAKTVTGVDISNSVIEFAKQKYTRKNLSFKVGSTSNIPMEDNSVDVLVSFETIEHHDEHVQMMDEITRVLKEDGVLIISSPNKEFYSDKTGYSNPFHVKELYKKEFEQLIESYFPHYTSFDQQIVYGSLISSSSNTGSKFSEYSGDFEKINKSDHITESMYTVTIASKKPLNTDHFSVNSFFRSDRHLELLMNQSQEVYDSKTYKIGNLIVSPFRVLKKLFTK